MILVNYFCIGIGMVTKNRSSEVKLKYFLTTAILPDFVVIFELV